MKLEVDEQRHLEEVNRVVDAISQVVNDETYAILLDALIGSLYKFTLQLSEDLDQQPDNLEPQQQKRIYFECLADVIEQFAETLKMRVSRTLN